MKLGAQPLRYLAVVVLGLAIDLGLAILLAGAGLPRAVASIIGLIVASVSNFVLHRLWTFRSGKERPVGSQLVGYLVGLGLTMLVRMGTLAIVGLSLPALGNTIALAIAVGVSFTFNFFFLNRLVFIKKVSP